MADDVTDAWEDLFRVLPDGWVVMRPMWRQDDGMWFVHARWLGGPRWSQRAIREAYGSTEAAALQALAQQFRTSP